MIHEKAVLAALNAAFAVCESEHWMLGAGPGETAAENGKSAKAWRKEREAWFAFARENPTAPAEALWIKGGALGLHDGTVAYAELPTLNQIAFATFQRVLNDVSDALDAAQAAEDERLAREAATIAAAANPPPPPDYEGTPLEPVADPMAPSEFARAPAAEPESTS